MDEQPTLVYLAGKQDPAHRVSDDSRRTLCGKDIPQKAIWTNKAAKLCQDCRASDPRRARFIDQMLEYLAHPISVSVPGHTIRAEDFDGAEPWCYGSTEWQKEGDDSLIQFDLTPKELRNVDLRLIVDEDVENPGELVLSRLRSVDAKTIRGRVRTFLPYPVIYTVYWPAINQGHHVIYGWAGKWVMIDALYKPLASLDRFWAENIMAGFGLAQRKARTWRVYFAIDGNPGIELPTSPIGAREVYRLRDIPPGKDRRAALRHWVTEHWRINVHEPLEDVLVREHLRGATEFHWSGLHCRITPSEPDIIRAVDARERRKEARIDGTDRRMETW